jgi:hypothetical protein
VENGIIERNPVEYEGLFFCFVRKALLYGGGMSGSHWLHEQFRNIADSVKRFAIS